MSFFYSLALDCLLTIIVPLYNNADSVARCLDSVAASMPLDGVELLVVDDGSTDDGCQRVLMSGLREPILRLISQPHGGAAVARNRGLKAAAGEWVWFVDADDWIATNALTYLLPALEQCPPQTLLFKLGKLFFSNDDGSSFGKSGSDNSPAFHGDTIVNRFDLGDDHDIRHSCDTKKVKIKKTSPMSVQSLFVPQSGCLDHTTYVFRREFLQRSGLRYPAGRCCLEDSVFVLDVLEAVAKREERLHKTLPKAASKLLMGNETFRFYHYCEGGRSTSHGGWDEERTELMMGDILPFFDILQERLPQLATNASAANAFYTRYAYVYMRVMAVKGCSWHQIERLREQVLPYYRPTNLMAKLLRNAFLHRSFQRLCIKLRGFSRPADEC